jgi:DUF971 family protein
VNSATRPVPLEITRANAADVRVRWSDGHDAVYPALYLRQRCPCAVCQTARGPEDADVHPLAITAVGGYAIQLEWSDGHSTGVYSYDYLRAICPCRICAEGGAAG